MPYAAPKSIEMYMDPGSEKVWTLEYQFGIQATPGIITHKR